MEEAYLIGIRLALDDGITAGLKAIEGELATLDTAIATTIAHLAHLQSMAAATDLHRLSDTGAQLLSPALAPATPRPEPSPTAPQESPLPSPRSFQEGPGEGFRDQLRPIPQAAQRAQFEAAQFEAAAPIPPQPTPPASPLLMREGPGEGFRDQHRPTPQAPLAPAQPQASQPQAPHPQSAPPEPRSPTIIILSPPPLALAPAPREAATTPAAPAAPITTVNENPTPAPRDSLAPRPPTPAAHHHREPDAKSRSQPAAPHHYPAAHQGAPVAPYAPPPAPSPQPPPAQAAPTGGAVFLDGHHVGHWLADHLAQEASRPSAATTGFDPRLTPAYPGALQGN